MAKTKQPSALKIQPSNRVTVYRDGDGNEVAVSTCGGCDGRGCEKCSGLGFRRIDASHPSEGHR